MAWIAPPKPDEPLALKSLSWISTSERTIVMAPPQHPQASRALAGGRPFSMKQLPRIETLASIRRRVAPLSAKVVSSIVTRRDSGMRSGVG